MSKPDENFVMVAVCDKCFTEAEFNNFEDAIEFLTYHEHDIFGFGPLPEAFDDLEDEPDESQ